MHSNLHRISESDRAMRRLVNPTPLDRILDAGSAIRWWWKNVREAFTDDEMNGRHSKSSQLTVGDLEAQLLAEVKYRLEMFHVNGDMEAERCPFGPFHCAGEHWSSAQEADMVLDAWRMGSNSHDGRLVQESTDSLMEVLSSAVSRDELYGDARVSIHLWQTMNKDARRLCLAVALDSISSGSLAYSLDRINEINIELGHQARAKNVDSASSHPLSSIIQHGFVQVVQTTSGMTYNLQNNRYVSATQSIVRMLAYADQLRSLGVLEEVLQDEGFTPQQVFDFPLNQSPNPH